jgi:thiopeptide-type bacteriocin biosynthesis protein
MYQYLDAVLVRAPAWDARSLGLPWPDVTGAGAAADASWRGWLDRAWQVPELASAVEAASPDLARQVVRIREAGDVSNAAVRRAALSVLRYLLRGSSRATPFGLLAGIAPARIGPYAVIRTGTRHRAVARADATWLMSVVEALETDDRLLPCLTVVASDLVAERADNLILGHCSSGSRGSAPERVQVRATRPVRAALQAAQSPIRVADLAAKLAADFPTATSEVIVSLITRLTGLRFLVSSLRAPMTAADPLTRLLAELEVTAPRGDGRMAGLQAVSARLARHNCAPDAAAARAERDHATAQMTGIQPTTRPVLVIDLRLDWGLTIPEAVAVEAASAASILTRLARRPALSLGWVAWHARFLERYGPGAMVPVLDATDNSAGLGFPVGYLGSPHAGHTSALSDRDRTLLRLAQRAAMRHEQKITLDDALIADLAGVGPDDPVQPSAELTVRVHAASTPDLDEGRFMLHVLGVSRGAGTVTGRLLGLLNADDRERMRGAYAALAGVHRDSLLAQISAVPLYTRSENVTRAPQAAELLISLGEHRATSLAQQVPVSDLAVTADARRLHLVSIARRRPVHTIMLNAVDLTIHTHPLARFLLEAPVAMAAPCTAFDWGAASALPFVPALRYRRTVISPARWMLSAADLPGQDTSWPQWNNALTAWANQSYLPRHVLAGDGDRCLTLDLGEPSHRALLRAEVDRTGNARLRAAPGPGDLGWAGGHPHEITIPLAATGPAVAPVRWRGEVTRRGHGYLPGCDGRLYLKLYAPHDLQDAILTRHLPSLASRLGDQARWWFIRYDNPEPQVRLRLTLGAGTVGAAAEEAGAWASELRDAGLITCVSWETYYPEGARFGGTAVMDAAEAFFAADSAAAVAQIAASADKGGPAFRALTAASMANIAAAATGDDAEAMRWLTGLAKPDSSPPPRKVYDQAVALVCESRPGASAGVTQAWRARRTALAGYRSALEQAGTISLTDLLPDLLHLHHARIAGPDIAGERACLHLARAAALSWLARARKKAS